MIYLIGFILNYYDFQLEEIDLNVTDMGKSIGEKGNNQEVTTLFVRNQLKSYIKVNKI